MQTITTIGLDIAKSVFQVHGADAGGQVFIRRQLKRRQVLAVCCKADLAQSLADVAFGPQRGHRRLDVSLKGSML